MTVQFRIKPDGSKFNSDNGLLLKWLLGLSATFIVYGATIPFNIDLSGTAIQANMSAVSWVPFVDPDGNRSSIPDIVQNLLLFIPFGFFGYLAYKNQWMRPIYSIVICGFLLSLSVEALQLLTSDRTTSVTDILSNTTGTLIGACCGLKSVNLLRRSADNSGFVNLLQNPFFYPFLIGFLLVAAGSLLPFDVSLNVSSVWAKIKAFVINPYMYSGGIKDEGVVFLRFFLFSLLGVLFFRQGENPSPVIKSILVSSGIGAFLEGSQFFIQSRMPGLSDFLVIVLASLAGALFAGSGLAIKIQRFWPLLGIIATLLSAAIFSLSPFQFNDRSLAMNWLPFFPYYEKTTFVAMANFFESALIYFPLGFITQYFYNNIRTFIYILAVTMIFCFSLEYSQQWVVGRFADITDVIGAIIGVMAGRMFCQFGQEMFIFADEKTYDNE